MNRTCTKCSATHPLTGEFWPKRSNHPLKFVSQCKQCWAARYQRWYEKPKVHEDAKRRARDRQRAKRAMKATSPPGPSCDLCGQPFDGHKRLAVPHFDHEHETNKFRGWICGWCNVALGMLGDNPDIADRAASYLRSRGCRRWRPCL